MIIELFNLPKISLNQWYSGSHWSKRKKNKDNYKLIVKGQFKHVFSKEKSYITDYLFIFKNNPLDATNCAGMAKVIEDIIFEDDKHDIVRKISIQSRKGKEDKVIINVKQMETVYYIKIEKETKDSWLLKIDDTQTVPFKKKNCFINEKKKEIQCPTNFYNKYFI